MKRECTPEFLESFDTALVTSHSEFELIARMNIDDYGQSRGQDHIDRTIDVAEIGGVKNRRIGRVAEQWRRFNWKAHVVETHRLDQCNVLGRGMSFEMRFRVIGRLRTPETQIDPAP